MGILSNLINMFSTKSTSISAKLSGRICTRTRISASDFKQNCKLKLVVDRYGTVDVLFGNFSLLSPETNLYSNLSWHDIGSGYYRDFRPVASGNALLLLLSLYSSHLVALWNPTMNEFKILPKSSVPRPPFVEEEYVYNYGLGFDPASEDYKVVRFLDFTFEDGSESLGVDTVELYSLKTDSWKKIAYPINDHVIPLLHPSPIYANGFYYWPSLYRERYYIIPFDLANEKFSSACIPMPDTDKLREEPENFILAEFQGSLAVVVYAHGDELTTEEKPFEFEIWVWTDESWTRVSVIDVFGAAIEHPLGLFKNEKFYLQNMMGEVVLFDCGTRILKNLGLNCEACIFPYVESSYSFHPRGEISQQGDN